MNEHKPKLKYAEIMASYACNLSCVGCTNYSNYHYEGYPAWSEVKHDIQAWLERVCFETFGIIGGEPFLNPDLEKWLRGLRMMMPSTPLTLVTNGTRLHRTRDLIGLLVECAPILLSVVPHLNRETTELWVKNAVEESGHRFHYTTVDGTNLDGVTDVVQKFTLDEPSICIEIFVPRIFVKSYRGFGQTMRPWQHDDPRKAIEICPCRYCPLLYQGRLYKCSQIALLRNHLTRLGLLDEKEWQPYIAYGGIGPTDDRAKIERFVNLFGHPEAICRMCPSKPDPDAWIDHEQNVETKQGWQRIHGTTWPPRDAAADVNPLQILPAKS